MKMHEDDAMRDVMPAPAMKADHAGGCEKRTQQAMSRMMPMREGGSH